MPCFPSWWPWVDVNLSDEWEKSPTARRKLNTRTREAERFTSCSALAKPRIEGRASEWPSVEQTSTPGWPLSAPPQTERAGRVQFKFSTSEPDPASPPPFLVVCGCWVTQLCPAPCGPKGCSLPGSSVHGISQASVPEGAAVSFSTFWSIQSQKRSFIFYFGSHLPRLPRSHTQVHISHKPLAVQAETASLFSVSPQYFYLGHLLGTFTILLPHGTDSTLTVGKSFTMSPHLKKKRKTTL